jgi:protein-S-isoprenylcysteine O-methyltransferase Ste14
MKRAGLGVLLIAWLYSVPFLLIVGLIRRTSSPVMATHAAAQAFGATTDNILTAALVLNLALPVAGVLLARLIRDEYWTRHFIWSLVGMALIYVAVLIAAHEATAPLIGWTPADQEPAPRVTQCIPISGGHGCPGG